MMKKRSTKHYKLPKGKILGYRTANADGKAHKGFQWVEGWNEAPDWNPAPVCGGGLHFLKWGEGDSGLLDWSDTATHWIVEADESETVTMPGKSKARRVYAWKFDSRQSALEFVLRVRPESVVHGITQHAGDHSTKTAGHHSTQTAGDHSTQKAGHYSTQTSGDHSTQTAGHYSTQKAGYRSTQTSGDRSTQTAGDYSTQTAGNRSTQTSGDHSTQTAGDYSTQTAGYRSTQTSGDHSTQTAGNRSTFCGGIGTVQICRYSVAKVSVQVVGENGVAPNVPYICVNGVWSRKGDV